MRQIKKNVSPFWNQYAFLTSSMFITNLPGSILYIVSADSFDRNNNNNNKE